MSFKPNQLSELYNFVNNDTTGTSIGVIELGGGYDPQEIKSYLDYIGASDKIHIKSYGNNNPSGNPQSADSEVYLDIDIIAAIVPNTQINVYFEDNSHLGFAKGIHKALNDGCTAISISWGAPEISYNQQDIQHIEDALKNAYEKNVPVFVAAGDRGFQDGIADGYPHVDYPSTSPHAVACGGVRLVVNGKNKLTQSVWNDGPSSSTGGGVSFVFGKPDFQKTVTIPEAVMENNVKVEQDKGRGVPDIAGLADPQTGYLIESDNSTFVEGGTSAVAPLFAAMYVQIVAVLGEHSKDMPHFLDFIYQHPECFADITEGNNGKWQATEGWDACTGLGVPIQSKLIDAYKQELGI